MRKGRAMRHIAAIVFCAATGTACAEPVDAWQPFADDAALEAFLIAHPLTYETGAWQSFLPSGRTLYRHVRTSWGYWRISDVRLCIQWPPANDWVCYETAHDDGMSVRFLDDWGNVSIGSWAE